MARPGRQQNQGRPARNITGPQSALTDFLASHNISARQIRDEADLRRRQALDTAHQNGEEEEAEDVHQTQSISSRRRSTQAPEQESETMKTNSAAIAKIKSSKAFKKRKRDADGSDDDDAIARAIFEERRAPLPGQMENCDECGKRFTVTPYSLAGPNGGLLCAPCGRKFAKEQQGPVKKKAPRKQTGGVGSRRTVQSRILDGDVGTKSLATLCVETLAKNVDMAEDLGDLPDHLIDKIARIFSKRRLLKTETLPLFVRPTTEVLGIYDGARLGEQDFLSIFQVASKLRDLKIRCAIQFKDEVMDYLLSRNITLERFYLHGANLLSEDKWHEFLVAKGEALKCLQVYYTDKHVGDDTISVIRQHCPNLTRLKIENNQKLTDKGIKTIGGIKTLEHVSLQLLHSLSPKAMREMIKGTGETLQTLSLKIVPDADDDVLEAIHTHCRSLAKLRITDSENITDDAFVKLFTDWSNPPLRFIDFQKCRHLDSTQPRDNPENIGLCSEGFKALMAHSGQHLVHLNVHACRHISREAFEEVFADTTYPELKTLEISFCEEVTDFILGRIFRSCPRIREINVFGCMKVRDIMVPRGVIVVGVPNAVGMITEAMD